MSKTLNKGNKGFQLMIPRTQKREEKNLLAHEFRLRIFQFELRFTISLKRLLEK